MWKKRSGDCRSRTEMPTWRWFRASTLIMPASAAVSPSARAICRWCVHLPAVDGQTQGTDQKDAHGDDNQEDGLTSLPRGLAHVSGNTGQDGGHDVE